MSTSEPSFDFEREYWGDCTNTYCEETKQLVYARLMGLPLVDYVIDMQGKSVIDVGGGPASLLLKCKNLGRAWVIDPLQYPNWTQDRYQYKGITVLQMEAESMPYAGHPHATLKQPFDEVWIYNCLQHVEDPAEILRRALLAGRLLRIFEWVNIPAHEGHPQMLTKEFLDDALGSSGVLVELRESNCWGTGYFNVVGR